MLHCLHKELAKEAILPWTTAKLHTHVDKNTMVTTLRRIHLKGRLEHLYKYNEFECPNSVGKGAQKQSNM